MNTATRPALRPSLLLSTTSSALILTPFLLYALQTAQSTLTQHQHHGDIGVLNFPLPNNTSARRIRHQSHHTAFARMQVDSQRSAPRHPADIGDGAVDRPGAEDTRDPDDPATAAGKLHTRPAVSGNDISARETLEEEGQEDFSGSRNVRDRLLDAGSDSSSDSGSADSSSDSIAVGVPSREVVLLDSSGGYEGAVPYPLPLVRKGEESGGEPASDAGPTPGAATSSTPPPTTPAPPPLVTTDCGEVSGLWMDVSTGGKVAAFLGIPYSEPPVGELRFKAPVPVAPWRRTKEATKFGPMCIQPGSHYVWDAVRFPTPTTPTPQHQTVRPKHHRNPQQHHKHKEERSAPEPSVLFSALIAERPLPPPVDLEAPGGRNGSSGAWSEEEEVTPASLGPPEMSTAAGASNRSTEAPSAPVMRRRRMRNYDMSEDCLSLNIYTPQLNTNGSTGDLPILFFIHGGSYYMNGGRLYPGEELAARGAVVVTFNYRLGPFGFLSTGEPSCRGNWGLWDQVEALRWVRRNAKSFGGDATNALCLVGNSAGAASVLLHMVSPVSRGLFSCAVAMSGCSGAPWALQPRPLRHAKSLASRLGCPAANRRPHHAVACLRTFSAHLIAENADLEDGLGVAFAPVVDGASFGGLVGGRRGGEGADGGSSVSGGGGPFIPDDPRRLMAEGKFAQVPFMSGLTRDEVSIWFSNFGPTMERRLMRVFLDKDIRQLLNSTGMPPLNSVALSHAAAHLYLWGGGRGEGGGGGPEETMRAADAARAAHYGEGPSRGAEPGARGSTLAVADFISDVGLKAPCTYDTELIARHNAKPSFFYEFQYHSVDDARTDKQEWIGAYHESELQFLFGEPFLGYSNHLRAANDKEVSEMLMSLWINFAKHGHPTPKGVEAVNCPVDWLPFTNTHRQYLALGYRPRMSENYLTERMVFWNYIADAFRRHPMPPYCNPTPTPPAQEDPLPFLPSHHWIWVFWVMAAGNAVALVLLGACVAKGLRRRFRRAGNRSATS
ncbi:neuroligin-2-like [Ischnura elegans]|uniref:neuroligin-2-like n=1 Tax=Ischnura elegans TaxID=197161 RepID=UPI001ED892D9|nr:neuroligin-2-like [Ischnura elegans]